MLMLRPALLLLTGACLWLKSSQAFLSDGPHSPLVIRQGGTYSGTFISTDETQPCVRVLTPEPVVLRNAYLEGPGHLIETTPGARLTVENCYGQGVLPASMKAAAGKFLVAESPQQLRIEHCTMVHTTGILVLRWAPRTSPAHTLTVRYNVSRNIDGRYRGGGGTTPSWLNLNKVLQVPAMEIAWNQVVNEPDSSLVEDNINLYNSSGTPASPLRVHDNYIQGAYPYPATAEHYFGSGMMTDGNGTTPATATAYVLAYNNQIISTCNAGMSIAAGHDIRYFHNRVVHSALLPDGRYLPSTFAGLAIFNYYDQSKAVFTRNLIDHNVVGYANRDYHVPVPGRHDMHHEACSHCPGQESLPGPITRQTEQQEWAYWQQKLAARHLRVGATVRKPAVSGPLAAQ